MTTPLYSQQSVEATVRKALSREREDVARLVEAYIGTEAIVDDIRARWNIVPTLAELGIKPEPQA